VPTRRSHDGGRDGEPHLPPTIAHAETRLQIESKEKEPHFSSRVIRLLPVSPLGGFSVRKVPCTAVSVGAGFRRRPFPARRPLHRFPPAVAFPSAVFAVRLLRRAKWAIVETGTVCRLSCR